jgi:two-component system CheB/CheR fusion protein
MVVVDREMRVVVWNRGCEELWGLRSDETVGHPLSSLDIGFPTDAVKPLIGKAFVDPEITEETVVDAVTRRGRQARIRVTCTAFRATTEGGGNGALLLMEVQN